MKMLEMCNELQKNIIINEVAEKLKPLIDDHHVTRNHKVKWHYQLALYLANHLVRNWSPPK